jgi:hypothetical protein
MSGQNPDLRGRSIRRIRALIRGRSRGRARPVRSLPGPGQTQQSASRTASHFRANTHRQPRPPAIMQRTGRGASRLAIGSRRGLTDGSGLAQTGGPDPPQRIPGVQPSASGPRRPHHSPPQETVLAHATERQVSCPKAVRPISPPKVVPAQPVRGTRCGLEALKGGQRAESTRHVLDTDNSPRRPIGTGGRHGPAFWTASTAWLRTNRGPVNLPRRPCRGPGSRASAAVARSAPGTGARAYTERAEFPQGLFTGQIH